MPSDCGAFKLFADLEPEQCHVLEAAGTVKSYAAGEVIAVEGAPEAPACFVLSGLVRGYRTSADGRQQTVARLGPSSAFYLPSVFSSDDSAPTTTEAVVDSSLLVIEQRAFRSVLVENPAIALAVLRDLSDKLRHLVALAHDLGLLNVRARVARFLLRLSEEEGGEGERWTHEKIASSIGTVREVVSRTLKALASDGVIELDRHRIHIRDREALARLADG